MKYIFTCVYMLDVLYRLNIKKLYPVCLVMPVKVYGLPCAFGYYLGPIYRKLKKKIINDFISFSCKDSSVTTL